MILCKTSIGKDKSGKPILCGKRVPKQYMESHQRLHRFGLLVMKPRSSGISTIVAEKIMKRRPLTEERATLHKQLRRERQAR